MRAIESSYRAVSAVFVRKTKRLFADADYTIGDGYATNAVDFSLFECSSSVVQRNIRCHRSAVARRNEEENEGCKCQNFSEHGRKNRIIRPRSTNYFSTA